MIHRLVLENLKHRPVRTFLSAIAIGVMVSMILTLVGMSRGMLNDLKMRSKGTGADIVVRGPNSAIIGFSGNSMSEKYVDLIRSEPHVEQVTATFIQPFGSLNSITGIHLEEFNRISGGFRYIEGGPFHGEGEVILDEVQARAAKVHAGGIFELGQKWRVAGIVEPGKLSRVFADIVPLQEQYAQTGKVGAIYVKVDNPANIPAVEASLKTKLETFSVLSLEELTSLFSPDNVPMLKPFTNVIIAISVIVGFLVVGLSMYTAVLERTREIGTLKAMGASSGYILGILIRETILLAMAGAVAGILLSFVARWLLLRFVPTFTTVVAPDWWPIAAGIALLGALIGALFPGLKAAHQDAIEALTYD
jgi:putative ABC transport system permease protein